MISSFNRAAMTALLLAVTGTGAAHADTIVIDFTGKVTDIDDTGGYLIGKVAVGDTFKGRYVYESTTPDDNPNAFIGHYPQQSWQASTGMDVRINGERFRTDPAPGPFYKLNVAVQNNFFTTPAWGVDEYRVLSHHNLMSVDIPGGESHNGHIEIWLRDTTILALDSDALPTAAPDLPAWTSNYFRIYDAGSAPNDRYHIAGVVTQARRCVGKHCRLAPADNVPVSVNQGR